MARPTFFYLWTTLCVFIFLTTFSTSVFGEYTITKITSTNTTEYRCLPTVGDPPVNVSITEPWQWNVAGGRQQIVLSLDNAHRKPYNGGDCLWNISQTALLNPPTPLEASYGAWQPNSLHLDLGALVFGPVFENEQPDRLTVIGYAHVVEDDMGKEVIGHWETVLYRSSGSNSGDGGLSGSGLLLNLAGYHSVLVSLSLGFMCSDKVPDRRNFRATFLWNAPVTLQDGVGAMTFPLPESWLPERHDNFKATVEFLPATADHLVLLNFTSLPVNTTVTTTSRNATTTTTSVSNSISVDSLPLDPLRMVFLQSSDKPGITISVDLPRPLERLVSFRYWQVRKDCSRTVQLRVGQPAQAISVPDRQTNESSVALRCAVFYTTTEPGDKLLLSTPGPSSLANMADQLYLYDPQGQPVLGLNNLANAHFSALDSISETNSAVVLYESPYLSPPNVDFQVPQIKAIPTQASKITLTNDTPVKVTFSAEDKTVHLLFSEEDFAKNVVLGFPSTSEKHSTKPEFTSVKLNSENPTSSSSSASIAPLLQYAHQITLTKGSL